jgi:hypothetical protein
MSGEMAFVSRPEIGSTFTFTAEFHRVHDRVLESVLRNTNSVLQTPPLPTCFRGMQALVVDGRPVRSEVTRHHLRRLGIQVLSLPLSSLLEYALKCRPVFRVLNQENGGVLGYFLHCI